MLKETLLLKPPLLTSFGLRGLGLGLLKPLLNALVGLAAPELLELLVRLWPLLLELPFLPCRKLLLLAMLLLLLLTLLLLFTLMAKLGLLLPFWNICALAATEEDPAGRAGVAAGDGGCPLSRPTRSEAVNFLGTGI